VLKSIVIKNFQSHKKTIIKLVKGVNVIVGKSQAGKTAIVRALELVLTNRPSGDRFVRHGEDSTSVTIRTYEGDKVVITKTPKGRTYKVNGTSYRKFGKTLPEEVEGVLKMSSINIQSQLDSPFLITSSGSEIAKTINRITKAEKVDDWISLASKEAARSRRAETIISGDISDIKVKLAGLQDIGAVSKKVKEVKVLNGRRLSVLEGWNSLRKLTDELESHSKKMIPIQGSLDLLPKVSKAEENLEQAKEIKAQTKLVSNFIHHSRLLLGINHAITYLTEKMARYVAIMAVIDRSRSDIDLIKSYISDVSEKKSIGSEVIDLKDVYLSAIMEDETCPTRFGRINAKAIKRIKDSI